MLGGKKVKKIGLSWKYILYFLIFIWVMTLVCRYVSANNVPEVETCRAEKKAVGDGEKRYPLCVPIEAVHADGEGNDFVYCIEERESIMGVVTVASKKHVEILAADDETAALGGDITVMDEIIVHSSGELKDGTKVKVT